MANTVIKLKKSSTPNEVPSTLEYGELAINYADGKLYYKNLTDQIVQVAGGGGGGADSFGVVNVAGTLLVADTSGDYLTIDQGDNIELSADIFTDAFMITANLSSVFQVANAAFDSANNVAPQVEPAFNTANAAYTVSNSAYTNANDAYTVANSAYTNANATLTLAQAAFDRANLSNDILFIESSYNTANAAYDKANAANLLAYNTGIGANTYTDTIGLAAFDHANSVGVSANVYTNLSTTAANNYAGAMANSVNAYTNTSTTSANNWANTKLANTDGVVFNGTLNIRDNLYIGNNISHVNSIYFQADVNVVDATPGLMGWNTADNTLDIGLGNTSILQVGQETLYYVKNQTGATINNGSLVMYAGTLGSSGRMKVTPAVANGMFDSHLIMGVATQDILNGNDGFITHFGKVNDIHTAQWAEGDTLYADPSTPGGMTTTKPTAPNTKTLIGFVINSSNTTGKIFVRPTYGSSMMDDEKAEFTNIQNNDTIRWVSANNRFENVDPNTIDGAVNAAAAFGHSNAVYAAVNSAFAVINAAYTAQNTDYNTSNSAYVVANAAYDKANAANVLAYNTGIGANNYAGAMANSANDFAYAGYTNVSFVLSNNMANNAVAANNYAGAMANGAGTIANAAYDQANAGIDISNGIRPVANGAYVVANAAFDKANTALQNTSGTFNGNLTVAGAANVTSLKSNTYLDFDKLPYNTALVPYKEGRVWYDNDAKTLQIVTDYSDFDISVGEREWVRVRNDSGATIAKGKPVYVTGVHIPGHPVHGHHPTVALANAGSITKREVIGLAGHDIPTGSHGFVVTRGYIEGINTSALTSGSRVHLGFANDGDLVPYAPEYPNYPMDVGLCLTSNTTNGTMYVQIFDASFERVRVDQTARFGGDVTIEGDFFVLGTTTVTATTSQSYGAQYIYMGTEDTIPNSAVTFTGSGLNDLDFQGQYDGTSTSYYVKITEANSTGDYFSWSYDNFSTVEASNTLIQYQTRQYLSNGISVYFQANTGHTIGDKWNASATYVSADFGIIGNHNDGGSYTHAGLFRDATDGTFKFFRSYRPEPNGNIDIANTTFALGNVQVDTIYANAASVAGINVGVVIPVVFDKANASYTNANAAYDKANSANVLAYNTGIGANNYAGAMANSGNAWTQTIVDANLVTARAYTNTSVSSANDWSNTKVSAVTSNSTARVWANTVIVSGIETVYLDLSTSGVTATTYGGATQIPVLTVDAYGRITGASNVAVSGMDYAYVNTVWDSSNTKVAAISSNSTSRVWANSVTVGSVETVYLDLATSGVTATTYGGSTQIPVLTVDAYGRITGAANAAVQGMDYAYANTIWGVANGKVETVSSNSTSRIWANTVTVGSTETVYLDLATSGVTASAYSSGISAITVDAYGRVTSVTGSAGYVTSSGVTSVATGTGLTGGTITTTGTISLATYSSGSNAAVTGGISSITVDEYGRVRAVSGSAGYGTGTVTSVATGTGLTGGTITTTGTLSVDYTTFNTGLAAQTMTVTSLSDASGTISWDASTSRMATVTLSGTGRTMANPTNLKAGSYIFIVKQDGVGSKTITSWGTVFKWPAAVAPTLSTTASTTDVFSFWCDGTNLYGTYIPDCR
jgi:hypothetical protein